MDAVVSFLWADSAANEVLVDADGTQPSSFVAGFRPFRFTDGWGIVTPTSESRLRRHVQGARGRGLRRSARRNHRRAHQAPRRHRQGRRRVLRERGADHHGGRDGTFRGATGPVRDDPHAEGAARRSARGRGRAVRDAPAPRRRTGAAAAAPDAVQQNAGTRCAWAHRHSASTPTRSSASSVSATASPTCGRAASSPETSAGPGSGQLGGLLIARSSIAQRWISVPATSTARNGRLAPRLHDHGLRIRVRAALERRAADRALEPGACSAEPFAPPLLRPLPVPVPWYGSVEARGKRRAAGVSGSGCCERRCSRRGRSGRQRRRARSRTGFGPRRAGPRPRWAMMAAMSQRSMCILMSTTGLAPPVGTGVPGMPGGETARAAFATRGCRDRGLARPRK